MTREELIQQAEADALDGIAVGSDEVLEFVKNALDIDISSDVDAFLRYAFTKTRDPLHLSHDEYKARVRVLTDARRVIDGILNRYVAAKREEAEHETDEDRRAEADANYADTHDSAGRPK